MQGGVLRYQLTTVIKRPEVIMLGDIQAGWQSAAVVTGWVLHDLAGEITAKVAFSSRRTTVRKFCLLYKQV
jgi:hypothetical protein